MRILQTLITAIVLTNTCLGLNTAYRARFHKFKDDDEDEEIGGYFFIDFREPNKEPPEQNERADFSKLLADEMSFLKLDEKKRISPFGRLSEEELQEEAASSAQINSSENVRVTADQVPFLKLTEEKNSSVEPFKIRLRAEEARSLKRNVSARHYRSITKLKPFTKLKEGRNSSADILKRRDGEAISARKYSVGFFRELSDQNLLSKLYKHLNSSESGLKSLKPEDEEASSGQKKVDEGNSLGKLTKGKVVEGLSSSEQKRFVEGSGNSMRNKTKRELNEDEYPSEQDSGDESFRLLVDLIPFFRRDEDKSTSKGTTTTPTPRPEVDRFASSESTMFAELKQVHRFELQDRGRSPDLRFAEAAEHPYSVACHVTVDDNTKRICSGSLLTLGWILTSARCIRGALKIKVFAGTDLNGLLTDEIDGPDTRTTEEFLIDPDFNDEGGEHDVGLIRVSPAFSRSRYVKPVKLGTDRWSGARLCSLTALGLARREEGVGDECVRRTRVLEVERPCACGPASHACLGPGEDFRLCPGDSGGGLVCDGQLAAVATDASADNYIAGAASADPRCRRRQGGPAEPCGADVAFGSFQDTYQSLKFINHYVPYIGVLEPERTAKGSSSPAFAGTHLYPVALLTLAVNRLLNTPTNSYFNGALAD